VLVGQVLNSRGRFGPMMWAPIANNVISISVLAVYLFAFGPAQNLCDNTSDPSVLAGPNSVVGGYTGGQEALLGLGSTLGIVAQFLILLPYLKAAGFSYRPRFDFRGTGLGHTLRLGIWTVLFVVVNQVAYTVVVRLASGGTAAGAATCAARDVAGTGYTVYSNAFLLVMVPHAIATVSLATAMLPRLSSHAADDDVAGVSRNVAATLRTTLALIVPVALLFPVVALNLSNIVWGYGGARDTYSDFATALAVFAPGLVFFTVHYLMLRGFYALERTRTVFWVQCVIAATNVALALVVTSAVSPKQTAPGHALAYAGSYLVGAVCSYSLLRYTLGGLETPALVRFLVRLILAAGIATLLAWGAKSGVEALWAPNSGKVQALVLLGGTGAVDVVVFLLLARLLRIREVTSVLTLVTSRLRR
jgi:putative peptidoglycan lipid II flippase